jgi:hypothetical protein
LIIDSEMYACQWQELLTESCRQENAEDITYDCCGEGSYIKVTALSFTSVAAISWTPCKDSSFE